MVAHLLVDWYDRDADRCATVLVGGFGSVYRVEVLCHKLIQQEQWLELHKVMQSGLGAAIRSVSRRQDLEPWDVADRAAAFIKSVAQT